jgi:hypothetical protein
MPLHPDTTHAITPSSLSLPHLHRHAVDTRTTWRTRKRNPPRRYLYSSSCGRLLNELSTRCRFNPPKNHKNAQKQVASSSHSVGIRSRRLPLPELIKSLLAFTSLSSSMWYLQNIQVQPQVPAFRCIWYLQVQPQVPAFRCIWYLQVQPQVPAFRCIWYLQVQPQVPAFRCIWYLQVQPQTEGPNPGFTTANSLTTGLSSNRFRTGLDTGSTSFCGGDVTPIFICLFQSRRIGAARHFNGAVEGQLISFW